MTATTVDADMGRPAPDSSGAAGAIAYLDLALVVLALPIVLLAGAPLLGFGIGVGAWLVQRAAGIGIDRYARAAENPRTGLILAIAGLFLRLWFITFAVVLASKVGGREDALTAAVTLAVAFSAYFMGTIVANAATSEAKRKNKGKGGTA
ncbi:MAG: hypothetical protein QOH13_805 [Thermoleophilaceae bacterium]|jgi:hypothetical protein|nr:hypothetical protein [Thermoleophilaceae bacterium]